MIFLLFICIPLLKLFINVGIVNIFDTFFEKEVLLSIFLTVKVSFFAVVITFLTGIPLAYIIARYDFKGKAIIESIIDIPVMIPHTAAGIVLLIAFTQGKIGYFFTYLGIRIIDTETGIMLAMMFLSAPFLINGAKEGFKNLDTKLENVARTLGANKFSVFLRIALPNAKKDIINGMLMMWSRGLGEFGAVVIISYHPMVAPVLIFDRFNNYGLKYSAPVAASMIIFSIIIFLLVRTMNKYNTSE
jgi:molybdate/tungstate transport system permease protein